MYVALFGPVNMRIVHNSGPRICIGIRIPMCKCICTCTWYASMYTNVFAHAGLGIRVRNGPWDVLIVFRKGKNEPGKTKISTKIHKFQQNFNRGQISMISKDFHKQISSSTNLINKQINCNELLMISDKFSRVSSCFIKCQVISLMSFWWILEEYFRKSILGLEFVKINEFLMKLVEI